MNRLGKVGQVGDLPRIHAGVIAASAAIIAAFNVEARAVEADSRVDRWTELAAAHQPETCRRCVARSAPGVVSVADVVRRLRRESTPEHVNPTGAIDVMADLAHVAATPADDRDRQILRIADELAPRDVRAAASFAGALPPGRGQNAALLALFSVWVRADRQAALDWAQALPDAQARAAALQEVTRRLVAANVREALALVSAMREGPGRDDALCSLARHWVKIDRTAALAWAHEQAESPHKTKLLEVVSE